MNDERLFERLATHAGSADMDPAFEDHLYALLQREMRRTGRSSRPILLLAAALLLGLALAGAALVGSGMVELPDLSGGSAPQLAYGLDGDIYVADWDGANPVRIADGAPPGPGCGNFWGEGTMWSPDGRHFAYRSATGGDCPNTVYLRDAEGNPVTSFPGYGWRVSWSPDSTRVATWVEPYETIGIYGVDGVRQALLTLPAGHPVGGDYDPVWSPDGTSVLLPLSPEDHANPSEVWDLPVDGGAPRRVPDEDPRSSHSFAYSPDGASVAYLVYAEQGTTSLVVAAADGSNERMLISTARGMGAIGSEVGEIDASWGAPPLWSPTGDRILITGGNTLVGNELLAVDVATGTVTSLGSGPGSDRLEIRTYSPDGDRILYAVRDANYVAKGLWSVNADGSDPLLLVSGSDWGDWQPLPPDS
jgi:Tol biopolymer transport system component